MNRTIITDSYAPFGELPILPDRPDKTSEERERERIADRIRHADVLRRFGWADENLVEAQNRYGFPSSTGRKIIGKFGSEPIYSQRQINAWRERLLAFVETIR